MGYTWDILNKETYNNTTGHYKFRREYQYILNNGNKYFNRILDIAGGSGRFAIPLLDYSNDITVIDLNEEAIRILKERNHSINAISGDFIQSEIIDKYTLIICIEALGYFHDWELFFDKLNNLLVEDGRFIFTYTNPNSWRYLIRKIRHFRNGTFKYKVKNVREFKAFLKQKGFEVDNMEGMNWIPLPLSSNSKLVLFFEFLEKILALKRWYSQSPWILMSIKKIS